MFTKSTQVLCWVTRDRGGSKGDVPDEVFLQRRSLVSRSACKTCVVIPLPCKVPARLLRARIHFYSSSLSVPSMTYVIFFIIANLWSECDLGQPFQVTLDIRVYIICCILPFYTYLPSLWFYECMSHQLGSSSGYLSPNTSPNISSFKFQYSLKDHILEVSSSHLSGPLIIHFSRPYTHGNFSAIQF